jgi:dTDP-4-amino-4,6-dideoxygalactose transaminase
VFERGLCLPSDVKITGEEMERVVEIVKGCFK